MLALAYICVFYFCGITAPFLTDAGIIPSYREQHLDLRPLAKAPVPVTIPSAPTAWAATAEPRDLGLADHGDRHRCSRC